MARPRKKKILPNPIMFSSELTAKRNTENDTIEIYIGYTLIAIIKVDEPNDAYVKALNLVEMGFNKNKVAQIFGFDRSWMTNLINRKKKLGWEGIFNIKRGAPKKVTDEMVTFAIEEFLKHYKETGKLYNYQDKILSKLEIKFGKKISKEYLRKILKETKDELRKETGTVLSYIQ